MYKRWVLLQERTKLVLGLTYYETGNFEKAIEYLSAVSETDENYPKALLALAWCYLKLRQFHEMIGPLETIVNKFLDFYALPEVYLLLGQAHLKVRLYDKSIFYFSKILNLFPISSVNDSIYSSLEKQLGIFEKSIEEQKLNLILLETKLYQTIRLPEKKNWIPPFMLEEIRKLNQRRQRLLEEIEKERELIDQLSETIKAIRLRMEIRTKDWRSFAEYGISRALYLKERTQ